MVNAEASEVRYLTDDRDLPEQYELVIFAGGNGDWYISVVPKGEVSVRAVRICPSGGAAAAVPGLPTAIADAFRALANASGFGITHVRR